MGGTFATHAASRYSRQAIAVFWLTVVLLLFSAIQVAGSERHEESGMPGMAVPDLSDEGCLFFNPRLKPSAGDACTDSRLTTFLIEQLADEIVEGIFTRKRSQPHAAGFSDVSVDLTELIKNCVDQAFGSEDPYWQYYSHCDRWQVNFANQSVQKRLTPSQEIYEMLGRWFRQFEFELVENLTTRESGRGEQWVKTDPVNLSKKLVSAMKHAYHPLTRVVEIVEKKFQLLSSRFRRLETLAYQIRNSFEESFSVSFRSDSKSTH